MFTPEQQQELDDLSMRINRWVDREIRQRTGKQPIDYLNQWLTVGREYGYATQDGSWGEFEKEFAIIVTRMVVAERKLEMLTAAPPERQP